MRRTALLTLLLSITICTRSAAADGDTPGIVRFIHKLAAHIDSATTRGTDPRYLTAPEKPWQLIVRGNVTETELKMKSTIDGSAIFTNVIGDMHWEPRIKTDPTFYTGFWAGYRGYGVGYSKNFGGDKGSLITIGATGGAYGVNVRLHRYESDEPEVHFVGYTPQREEYTERMQLEEPIKVHVLTLDAFYYLNGKRFSYSAAYDQSVIQLRSAGSFVVGAMYYYGRASYEQDRNAYFMLLMNDIGRMQHWQAGITLGYAYNWVPARGWLVSAMAIPLLTLFNRVRTYHYDSNLRQLAYDDNIYEDNQLPSVNDWKVSQSEVITENGGIRLSMNARFSLTYQWRNLFLNANGQFYRFGYHADRQKGRLVDWNVNTSIGVRF